MPLLDIMQKRQYDRIITDRSYAGQAHVFQEAFIETPDTIAKKFYRASVFQLNLFQFNKFSTNEKLAAIIDCPGTNYLIFGAHQYLLSEVPGHLRRSNLIRIRVK